MVRKKIDFSLLDEIDSHLNKLNIYNNDDFPDLTFGVGFLQEQANNHPEYFLSMINEDITHISIIMGLIDRFRVSHKFVK